MCASKPLCNELFKANQVFELSGITHGTRLKGTNTMQIC